MDLIGTILVGPKEVGLERSLKSLRDCGCEVIHALIDTIDSKSADVLVKYDCAVFDREWDWNWGAGRQFLQNTIPPGVKWQLWLDADDEIPEPSVAAIRRLVQTPPAIVSMPYVYVEGGKSFRSLYRLRMFPPNGVHWYLHAHECATFSSGLRTLVLNIPILHHWYAHDRSRHLHYVEGLTKDLQERPNDPRVMFYLAQSQRDAGMVEESIAMYERYLASGGGWSQERMKACLMLSQMHQQRGALEKALQSAQNAAEELDEERREVYQRTGEVHYAIGNYEEAYNWFKKELEVPRPQAPLLYVCEDHYRKRPFEWLLFTCDKLNKVEEGIECCTSILRMDPSDTNALYNLGVLQKRQQRQAVIGDMPAPASDKPLICLFAGPALERWSANSLDEGGIGGLETANVRMSWAFQKLGWEVALFANCAGGEYRGIKHVHYSRFHEYCKLHKPDVVIISRHSDLVDRDLPARFKVLWAHDLHFGDSPDSSSIFLTKERIKKFDLIMFQSPYHRQLNSKRYGIPEEKQLLIRLGIDTTPFEKTQAERNPKRCIYASSPDRGLPRLLEFWPEIKRMAPDAELHVFYGFGNYLGRFASSPEPVRKQAQAWVDELTALMQELPGVEYHGRVGQAELAEEFMKSAVWTHPTNFQETLCITALTACTAGCVPLTSDLAALHTTVGEYGILLEGNADAYEYRERFITELIRLLTDSAYWKKWSEIARRNIYDRCSGDMPYWSWDAIAGEIDDAIRSQLPEPQQVRDGGVYVELGAGEHPVMDERKIIHTDLAEGMEHIECMCDARNLPFKDSSLAGILMHQVLEHSGWRETQSALVGCWNALEPGGSISVAVPDFYSQAEQFVQGRKGLCRILDMVFASQSRPENTHKTAFTLASLRSALARAGFSLAKASVNSGESELTTWDSLSAEAVRPEQDKGWIDGIARQKLGTGGYPAHLYGQGDGWWHEYPWELKARVRVHRGGQLGTPDLSVIVIAHRQKEERTVKCVEKLRSVLMGFPYELVGVDDGSSDGTVEFFKERADVAVQLPERRGICEAYNAGIAASNAPVVCLVQNDADVEKNVIPRMYEFLSKRSDVGIVCPMFAGKRYMGEAEDGFTLLPPYPESGGSVWDMQIPAGPCMMLRRSDLVRAGLFDTYLFNMWADHDIGRAIADLGLHVAIMTEPVCGYFPGNVSILEAQPYTEQERLRRFMSAYYFHLKWGYELDRKRLMGIQV